MKKIALVLTLSLPMAAHANNWLDLANAVITTTQQATGNNSGLLSQVGSITQALSQNQTAAQQAATQQALVQQNVNTVQGALQASYLQNLNCMGLATEFTKQQALAQTAQATATTQNSNSNSALLGLAGSVLSNLSGGSGAMSQVGQIASGLANQSSTNTANSTQYNLAQQNMQNIAQFMAANRCGQ